MSDIKNSIRRIVIAVIAAAIAACRVSPETVTINVIIAAAVGLAAELAYGCALREFAGDRPGAGRR